MLWSEASWCRWQRPGRINKRAESVWLAAGFRGRVVAFGAQGQGCPAAERLPCVIQHPGGIHLPSNLCHPDVAVSFMISQSWALFPNYYHSGRFAMAIRVRQCQGVMECFTENVIFNQKHATRTKCLSPLHGAHSKPTFLRFVRRDK